MNLYTFIMDFRGGTYISQVNASNELQAVEFWAKELNIKEIQYIGDKTKQEIIKELPELIKDNEITPINSVKNVWLFTLLLKTGFAVIHIIKTGI